jgi:hypothetical protein
MYVASAIGGGRLLDPGRATVASLEEHDVAIVAMNTQYPARLWTDEIHVLQGGCDWAVLPLPSCAAVAGMQDSSALAYRPAGLCIPEGYIIEVLDLADDLLPTPASGIVGLVG